jgi:type IV secretion system protein VirB9
LLSARSHFAANLPTEVLCRGPGRGAQASGRCGQDRADAAKADAAKAIENSVNKFRASYPTQIHFPYWIKGNGKPFNVIAINHDDRFTYIRANASELPALYELKDNAPSLINFQIENGAYVVPKILDSGYLIIGQKKLTFDLGLGLP